VNVADFDDIEDLKIHRIEKRDNGRVHLAVADQPAPPDDVDEAFGGDAGRVVTPVYEDDLRARIVDALKTIEDPEIPLNIYDLGLIYGFEIDADQNVEIEMTLTAPACPVAGMLVTEVARKVGEVDGVRRSHVTLTWDPPWTKDRMSEEALLALGLL
jgi:FeS assembly SUF system protein